MKKILLSLFIHLFIPYYVFAGGVLFMAGGVEEGGDNYSDILFYHNMDAWITTPTKGSGTISYLGFTSEIVETTTKLAGTGSLDMNNDGFGKMFMSTASNFSFDDSRIGFWIHVNEVISQSTQLIKAQLDGGNPTNNDLQLNSNSDGTLSLTFKGSSIITTTATISNGNAYYIEIALNGNDGELFIDDVSVGSGTQASPLTVTANQLRFFSFDNILDCYWDQLIISDDYTRNIYDIRTITDFN